MIELDIQERWPEMEHRIVNKPDDAARYAIRLGFRWPEAEPAILKSQLLVMYIYECIKGRWEEAEAFLDDHQLIVYALNHVKERVPAIEQRMLDSIKRIDYTTASHYLVQYSIKVIGSRWSELESIVEERDDLDGTWLIEYVEHHQFRWDRLEKLLAKRRSLRNSIIRYSEKVLNGQRSLAFEQFFENNPEYSALFKKYCDLVDWSRPDTGPINDFVAKRMKRWMKAGTI